VTLAGDLLAVARVAAALSDLGDPAGRVGLQHRDGRPSAAGMLAIARELGQGILLLGAGRAAHRVGGVVDAVHAISMVGYAVILPRRGAHAEAIRAGCLAAAEWMLP
jgi:hypothetical protein